MSEHFLPLRRRVPAIVPLLLSFTAGFIDSFTVLALFGLFVAQVTGSNLARFSCAFRPLPAIACVSEITIESPLLPSACFRVFPDVY